MQIRRGIAKLLKILNKTYFNVDVLKYILPEEITRKIIKATIQNLNNARISNFFDFGQEKVVDCDNSMNSFVGCCSLGTGHLASFINCTYGNVRLSPLLQNDSRS